MAVGEGTVENVELGPVPDSSLWANQRVFLKGTVRGMHYQLGKAAEVKLVRCTAGALFDVALDLRPDSATFGQWFGAELTADNHSMLYVSRGCAHGFVTLTENAEVFYLVSSPYTPSLERSVRYNDPRFGVRWPIPVEQVSPKDANSPDFDPVYHGTAQLTGFTRGEL